MYKVKTIDIQAKEWFDKSAGNSYFSARVTLNYGMDNAEQIVLPFQYGYGEHYQHMAFKKLAELGFVKPESDHQAIWRYCDENKIILRYNKEERCKKSEVVSFGSIPSTTDRITNFKA